MFFGVFKIYFFPIFLCMKQRKKKRHFFPLSYYLKKKFFFRISSWYSIKNKCQFSRLGCKCVSLLCFVSAAKFTDWLNQSEFCSHQQTDVQVHLPDLSSAEVSLLCSECLGQPCSNAAPTRFCWDKPSPWICLPFAGCQRDITMSSAHWRVSQTRISY